MKENEEEEEEEKFLNKLNLNNFFFKKVSFKFIYKNIFFNLNKNNEKRKNYILIIK